MRVHEAYVAEMPDRGGLRLAQQRHHVGRDLRRWVVDDEHHTVSLRMVLLAASHDGACFVASLLTRNPDSGLAPSVIPAQAGSQYTGGTSAVWIPACAGMTDGRCARRTASVSSVCPTAGQELAITVRMCV